MRAPIAIAALGAALAMPAAAGAWEQAARLTAGDGADYRAAVVARNPAGDVAAAWVRSPARAAAGTGRVYVATRARGGARWVEARPVSGAGVSAPAVAINARGRAVVAWPLRDRVQVAVRADRASPWRTRTVVRASGTVTDVAVAVGSSGGMTLMWSEQRGPAHRVRMAEDRAGTGRWAIRGSSVGTRGRPALAVTPRRGGAVLWTDDGRVRAARNPGGVFERTVQLSDANGLDPVTVAMSPAGATLSAWGASLPGGTMVLSAAERGVDGGWRALGDIGLGQRPWAALNARGDAAVAWPVAAGQEGGAGIEGSTRRAGRDWEPAIVVPRAQCGCDYVVGSSAVDGSGAIHVSWLRTGTAAPTAVVAVATRAASGGPWRRVTLGNRADAAPRLTADAGGGAAAVWAAAGSGGGVWASAHAGGR